MKLRLSSSDRAFKELCLRLKEHGLLHSPEAIAAYASVDRGDFILGAAAPCFATQNRMGAFKTACICEVFSCHVFGYV